METIYGIDGVRTAIARARDRGASVALVPTMGNLHGGHLALVARARAQCNFTAVSIFVNPSQFGPADDFSGYPRTLDADIAALEAAGVDFLFVPGVEDIYPGGSDESTRVEVPGLGNILCGAFRPGFFRGVCTVVCLLLNRVQPDAALFGEKDYQQLVIVRRMVRDLHLPVEIVPVSTVREADGLAMSSRNVYLDPGQRERAPILYRRLCAARDALEAGADDLESLEAEGMAALAEAGLVPDYFAIRRAGDLAPPGSGDRDCRILTAAHLGAARLIDNVPATRSTPGPGGGS